MSGKQKFRVVGSYLYPPLVSTESFDTKEAAAAENRRWTKQAEEQGMRWKGRVVEESKVTNPTPSEKP